MLEDELREMFAARVHALPAVDDPAGVAVRRARRVTRRRAFAAGACVLLVFVAAVGLGIGRRGHPGSGLQAAAQAGVNWQNLYGDSPTEVKPTAAQPGPPAAGADIRAGAQLWTSEGKHYQLDGIAEVRHVVRVPDGWVYSDDRRIRLLTPDNTSMPLTTGSAWAVSPDGSLLAAVDGGQLTVTAITAPAPNRLWAAEVDPATKPVTFVGQRVVLASRKGLDHFAAQAGIFQPNWQKDPFLVVGTVERNTVGLRMRGPVACIVEVVPIQHGFDTGDTIACGGVLAKATAVTRSTDPRWLAVTSDSLVSIVDLEATRAAAEAQESRRRPAEVAPFVAVNCPWRPDTGFVWAAADIVVTGGADGGLLACRTDGKTATVALPAGVSPGWEIVPAYGVNS